MPLKLVVGRGGLDHILEEELKSDGLDQIEPNPLTGASNPYPDFFFNLLAFNLNSLFVSSVSVHYWH